MNFSKIISIVFISIAMSACIHKAVEAVIPQKKFDAAAVAQVKSVAIVAYDVLQFQPSGVGSKLSGSIAAAQMVSNTQAVENELVPDTYGYMLAELKNRGFKTQSLSSVVQNSGYKQFVAQFKPSVQEKLVANHFQKPLITKGLLRPTNPEYLFTPEQIKQLGRALNVDALVISRLMYTTQKTDYLGLGIASAYLRADMQFHMFDTKTGQMIWFDRGFMGAASDESIGKVSGMEDVELIEKLSRPIAQKTFQDFFKK